MVILDEKPLSELIKHSQIAKIKTMMSMSKRGPIFFNLATFSRENRVVPLENNGSFLRELPVISHLKGLKGNVMHQLGLTNSQVSINY